ncbi:MAG: class I tRNA ligase family protein, partial [Myxococcota bacterium]
AQFGADAMRLYEMFMGPLEAVKPWSTSSIQGVARFLDKVWAAATGPLTDAAASEDIERITHQTIKKVTDDIEALRFNTAISAMMSLVNELGRLNEVPKRNIQILVQLVHPFAPHLAEELWERLGNAPSVQDASWPTYDEALLVEKELEIPVQVNGKKRGVVRVPPGATEEQVFAKASSDPSIAKHWDGKTLARTIWVQDRILTLVVKG